MRQFYNPIPRAVSLLLLPLAAASRSLRSRRTLCCPPRHWPSARGQLPDSGKLPGKVFFVEVIFSVGFGGPQTRSARKYGCTPNVTGSYAKRAELPTAHGVIFLDVTKTPQLRDREFRRNSSLRAAINVNKTPELQDGEFH